MQDEKVKELESLLGSEAVKNVLGTTDTAEKQADSMGVAFKELKDGQPLTKDQANALLEYAIKAYEDAETAEAAKESKESDSEDEEQHDPACQGAIAQASHLAPEENAGIDQPDSQR